MALTTLVACSGIIGAGCGGGLPGHEIGGSDSLDTSVQDQMPGDPGVDALEAVGPDLWTELHLEVPSDTLLDRPEALQDADANGPSDDGGIPGGPGFNAYG